MLKALLAIYLLLFTVAFVGCSEKQFVKGNRLLAYKTTISTMTDKKKNTIKLGVTKAEIEEGYIKYDLIQIVNAKNEVLFDSEAVGLKGFAGDYFDETKKQYLKISDDNKNGIPEMYLREYAFGSSSSRYLIIEVVKGNYQIIYEGNMDAYKYTDLDKDGVQELICTDESGSAGLFPKITYVVNKRVGSKYLPSYELTKLFTKERAEAIVNNTHNGIMMKLVLYAILGDRDLGMNLITGNMEVINKSKYEPGRPESEVISRFENLLKHQNAWLESLKDSK